MSIEHAMIVDQVKIIRESHRYMGTRKLYEVLQPFLREHQIKIGVDGLFDMLSTKQAISTSKKAKSCNYQLIPQIPQMAQGSSVYKA